VRKTNVSSKRTRGVSGSTRNDGRKKNSIRRRRKSETDAEPVVLGERNIDDTAFSLTFDEGDGLYSTLTCFRIEEEHACLVLGECDGELTAFIDQLPEDEDDD
jgi:hypothetical protein